MCALVTGVQTCALPISPGWGSAYKLSGQAAIGWSYKFDKKGKKFANGLPVTGAYLTGVKVYDPRLDSTFPGGSGSCRLGNKSEEHTSELQSLMRISYAVFCLKTTINNKHYSTIHNTHL